MKRRTYGKNLDQLLEKLLTGKAISDRDWECLIDEIDYSVPNIKVVRNLLIQLQGLCQRPNYLLPADMLSSIQDAQESVADELNRLDLRRIVNDIPRKCSIWLHDEIKKDIIIPPGANHHEFFAERIAWDGLTLVIIAHNNIMLRIDGDQLILRYLELILPEYLGKTEHEILQGINVPASGDELKQKTALILKEMKKTSQEITRIADLLRHAITSWCLE